MFYDASRVPESDFFSKKSGICLPVEKISNTLNSEPQPFIAKELPKDQWFSKFIENHMFDEKDFLVEALTQEKLPPLEKDDLTALVKRLSKPFVIKAGEGKFPDIHTSLAEMLIYLKGKFPCIDHTELVGGAVIWVLKTYLIKCLRRLGVKDPESWLTSELLNEMAKPSDYDFRFNAQKASNEELIDFKEEMVKFIAEKAKTDEYMARQYGFIKFNTQFGENQYTTVAVGDPNGVPVDLLFVRKLEQLSLFIQDSLRISIDSVLEGIAKHGAEHLLELIDQDKFLPAIVPESDFKNGWQAVVDRVGGVCRSNSPYEVKGWISLASAFSKGKRGCQEYLEEDWIETLFDEVEHYHSGNMNVPRKLAELLEGREFDLEKDPHDGLSVFALYWINHFFKNHQRSNPYALIALKFHTSAFLKKRWEIKGGGFEKYITEIWQGISPIFTEKYPSKPDSILLKMEAIMQQSPHLFELLSALIQAKAYFYLHSEDQTKKENFKASLIVHHTKPAIQVYVDGCYLLMPFDPIAAFQVILSQYKNLKKADEKQAFDELIELLNFDSTFDRSKPSQMTRNFQNLKLSAHSLELVAEELFESSEFFLKKAGYHLLLLGNIFTNNSHTFPYLREHFAEFLNREITEDVSGLVSLAENFAVTELDSNLYRKFGHLLRQNPREKELMILWACSTAGLDEKLSLQAYNIWQESTQEEAKENYLNEFLKALSLKKPELALEVLKKFSDEGKKFSKPQLFVDVCHSAKKIPTHALLVRIRDLADNAMEVIDAKTELPEELFETLEWLIDELFKQNELEQGIQLLKFSMRLLYQSSHRKENEVLICKWCGQIFENGSCTEAFNLWKEGEELKVWNQDSTIYQEQLIAILKKIYAQSDTSNHSLGNEILLSLCSATKVEKKEQIQDWIVSYLEKRMEKKGDDATQEFLTGPGRFLENNLSLELKLKMLEKELDSKEVLKAGRALKKILKKESNFGLYPISELIVKAVKALTEKNFLLLASKILFLTNQEPQQSAEKELELKGEKTDQEADELKAGMILEKLLKSESTFNFLLVDAFVMKVIQTLIEKDFLHLAYAMILLEKTESLFVNRLSEKMELVNSLLQKISKTNDAGLKDKGWDLLIKLLRSGDLQKATKEVQINCCIHGLKCLSSTNKDGILVALNEFPLFFNIFNKSTFKKESYQAYRYLFCAVSKGLLNQKEISKESIAKLCSRRREIIHVLESPVTTSKNLSKEQKSLQNLQREARVAIDLEVAKVLVTSPTKKTFVYGCSLLEHVLKSTDSKQSIKGLCSTLEKLTHQLLDFSLKESDPVIIKIKSIFKQARERTKSKSEFIPLVSILTEGANEAFVYEACQFALEIIEDSKSFSHPQFREDMEFLMDSVIRLHSPDVLNSLCYCLRSVNFNSVISIEKILSFFEILNSKIVEYLRGGLQVDGSSLSPCSSLDNLLDECPSLVDTDDNVLDIHEGNELRSEAFEKMVTAYLDLTLVVLYHFSQNSKSCDNIKKTIYRLLKEIFCLKDADLFTKLYKGAFQCLKYHARKTCHDLAEKEEVKTDIEEVLETEVNNCRIKFTLDLLKTKTHDHAVKMGIMNLAQKLISELFMNKNKDSSLFLELVDQYVFMDFFEEHTDLYNNHLFILQLSIGQAINLGLLDQHPKLLFQYACLVNLDISDKLSLIESSQFPAYFKELFLRLLHSECPQGMITALKLIQEYLPDFLLKDPVLLCQLYEIILKKEKEVFLVSEDKTFLELISEGIFKKCANVSNPLMALEKEREWNEATHDIVKMIFNSIIHQECEEKDQSNLKNSFINAINFLRRAFLNRCFFENDHVYMDLLNRLVNSASKELVGNRAAYISLWEKVCFCLIMENPKFPLTPLEREQRGSHLSAYILPYINDEISSLLEIDLSDIRKKALDIFKIAVEKGILQKGTKDYLAIQNVLDRKTEKKD